MTDKKTESEKRIYLVTNSEEEGGERLIEASNAAQAIRHATKPFQARLASQRDLVRLISSDVEVEKASSE